VIVTSVNMLLFQWDLARKLGIWSSLARK